MFERTCRGIAFIAMARIFAPNRFRAAGVIWKPPSEQLLLSRRLARNGLTAYSNAKRRGLEGVVAKDSDAPYEEHRSGKWLKAKVHLEEEFVIGVFTAPAAKPRNRR